MTDDTEQHDELDDTGLATKLGAGIACAPLLAHPKSWIRRRVETIDMLAHEETHRKVSVDFVLTEE